MRRKETRLPPRRFLEETSRRQSIRATGKDHLVHRHVMPDQTAPRADSCRSLPTSPNELHLFEVRKAVDSKKVTRMLKDVEGDTLFLGRDAWVAWYM